MSSLLYFAYGSNLHPVRLRERVPSCREVATGHLVGHALRFHKRSVDGSSKCDALHTGRTADRVHGAVYRIDPRDKPGLDAVEALGQGYDEHPVTVRNGSATIETFTYLTQPDYVDNSLSPFEWYRSLVVLGARHHGLPADYVERIAAHSAIPDPDPQRRELHENLIARIRNGGLP